MIIMNRVSKIIAFVMAGFLITAGMFYYPGNSEAEENRATINVKVEKTRDGTWRVRDNRNNNVGTLRAGKNDKIFWDVKGSNMIFSFPDNFNVNDYFIIEEGMFSDGRSQYVEDNQKLRLTVKPNAPDLQVEYNIWVESERKLVIGNSPPVLIIR